ncbi:MAG: hypothetical protein J0L77_01870 [Alphaproteobacteria bacterium]|nr:hypothetical protein [Alphaproteobacteria bacterium]
MTSSLFMTRFLSCLSAGALAVTFILCLFETPAQKSIKLSEAGQAYYTQAYAQGLQRASSTYLLDMSARLLADAVSLDPSNPDHWSRLTTILRAKGAELQADQALAMAERLKNAPSSSPNATPDSVKVAFLLRPAAME